MIVEFNTLRSPVVKWRTELPDCAIPSEGDYVRRTNEKLRGNSMRYYVVSRMLVLDGDDFYYHVSLLPDV